jgi:hypothetical protein
MQPALGLAAEHGFYMRQPGAEEWMELSPDADLSWKDLALSTMRTYQESTDGSWIEEKQSAVVWHYRDADPDFGNWQVCMGMVHAWVCTVRPQGNPSAVFCKAVVPLPLTWRCGFDDVAGPPPGMLSGRGPIRCVHWLVLLQLFHALGC